MIIDFSSLNQPVTSENLKNFRRRFLPKHMLFGLTPLSIIILAVVAAALLLAGFSIYNYTGPDVQSYQHIAGAITIGVGLLPIVAFIKLAVTSKARGSAAYRSYRFAQANGLEFQLQIKDPKRSGLIFSDPKIKGSFIYNQIYRGGDRPFEIGNYYYQVGSGANQTLMSHYYGYVAVKLDRPLPHMVLDATPQVKIPGVSLSSVGVPFQKDQVLQLEGDFNNYFTLYAPKTYETDALYIFAPDLMVLFVDNLGRFSAEIIDDYLYVYSPRPFATDDKDTLLRLFKILETVGNKLVKAASRYTDDKPETIHVDAAETITPTKVQVGVDGRRLNQGKPLVFTLFVAVILIVIALSILKP